MKSIKEMYKPQTEERLKSKRNARMEQQLADFGKAVIRSLIGTWAEYPDETWQELMETALDCKLVSYEPYDYDKHGEVCDVEPGQMIFVWREVRNYLNVVNTSHDVEDKDEEN